MNSGNRGNKRERRRKGQSKRVAAQKRIKCGGRTEAKKGEKRPTEESGGAKVWEWQGQVGDGQY